MISYEPLLTTAFAADDGKGVYYPPQVLATVAEGVEASRDSS